MSPAPADKAQWVEGLLAHPKTILFTVGPDGRIQWISDQVRQVLGWAPETLVGKEAVAALLGEQKSVARDHSRAKMEGREERSSYETQVKARDGSTVWLEVASQAVRDATGALKAIHVLAIDITERRRAQDALDRSRQRLADLIENGNDFVYLHDFEGRFLAVNGAAVRLYGYTPEEFSRMSIRDLVDPAHLPRAAEQMRLKVEGRSTRSLPYELLTRTKSGRPVWVEVSTTAVLADGKPVAVQGIARNINERKANDLALRLVQKVAFATGEAADFEDALATALEGLLEATGCVRAEGWVPNPDGRLRLAASWPEERSVQAEKFHRLSLQANYGRDDGVAGRVWREGSAVWVPDLAQEPGFQRAASATAAGLHSMLAVPVLADGGLVALILLFDDSRGQVAPPWQTLVESVASQLGSMLRLRRRHDRLEGQAALLGLQLDRAPVAILLVGQDGSVLTANRRFLELCGVDPPTAAPGLDGLDGSFASRLPDPKAFLAKARDFYETNRVGADELRVGERIVRRFVTDLPGPNGAAQARAIYLRDVTEVRRMERELAARKELVQSGPH